MSNSVFKHFSDVGFPAAAKPTHHFACNTATVHFYADGPSAPYCTYDFFDQCSHRMACALCGFYVSKASSKALLLEGKANLLRMRQEIPLIDDELKAVDEGIAAHGELVAKLSDVPTPDQADSRRVDAAP